MQISFDSKGRMIVEDMTLDAASIAELSMILMSMSKSASVTTNDVPESNRTLGLTQYRHVSQ